jgi:hypothetical protein
MPIPNRELSQFGSFLYVDNASRNIGIATTATPYVGIGTTNPSSKLTVIGDTNVSGVISATGYYLNGSQLLNAAVQTWELSGFDVYRATGNVGIGSTVPTEKLDIIGNIKLTGTITASNITGSNVSVSGVATASRLVSTVADGTAPLTVTSTTEVTNLNASLLRGGIPGSNINTFDVVTNGGTQTLTNKTLTLPTFGGTGVLFAGSTSGVTTVRSSATASGMIFLPAVSGIATFITTGDTGTVTSNMIADLNITNSDIAVGAGITYGKLSLTGSIVNADIASGAAISVSKLDSPTISGVSLGGTLNNLTAGSFISYSSGTTYNGSAAITVSVAATTANTGNTIVARDISGDFTAGTISVTNLTATTTVQAQDFNSTSDKSLKTNIATVGNALETVNSLRGVSFDWKENGKSSYGVIAQELEEVLPQLVTTLNNKSVNYNGLIGILIEAVKELSVEVKDLKAQLNK